MENKTQGNKSTLSANSKKLHLIRRPSGGNAVLHSGGLTYSLIWPSPPKKRKEAYLYTCKWLISAFSSLGLPLQFGNQKNQEYKVQLHFFLF